MASKNIIHSAKVALYFRRNREFGILKGDSGPLAHRVELARELLLHCDCLAESPSPIQVLSACNGASHLDKLVHLFMVSLVRFSSAWVADTKLAAVPVFVYAGVFVLFNLAYIPCEWQVLGFGPNEEISARTRRFAKNSLFIHVGDLRYCRAGLAEISMVRLWVNLLRFAGLSPTRDLGGCR